MRFTIVSPVYNVARYLDEFIASVEAQGDALADVEVVMVDDGSTDGSADRLAEWQQRRPDLVTVVSKPNGGLASARNFGLDRARGEWVTFTDPDDMLEPGALAAIGRFIDAHPDVELVGMNRVLLDDRTGRRHVHPLDVHFDDVDTMRNLDEHPSSFYGSAPCAFFRRAELDARGLRFDELLRPAFEDAQVCDAYLLRAPAPLVGFVRSATYVYRKRADGSSILDTARTDVRRYTTIFERGYLTLLLEAEQRFGRAPAWLQTHLLYELSWLFQSDAARPNPAVAAVADEVHRLLGEIAVRLDPEVVDGFTLRWFAPEWRDALVHGYAKAPWHATTAVVDGVDAARRTMRVTYRHTGAAPHERFVVDGTAALPLDTEDRPLPLLHRPLLHERVVTLPYGTLSVDLDASPVLLRTREPAPACRQLDGWRARVANPAPVDRSVRARAVRLLRRVVRRAARVVRTAGRA